MYHNKIMTTKELAEYIKLNEKTIIKMAQKGELPGIKIGSQWRFYLEKIDAFLQKDIVESTDEQLDLIINTSSDPVPLSRLITQDLIELDAEIDTRDAILDKLVSIASNKGLTSFSSEVLDELIKREEMLSTSVGNGIAVPHTRHPQYKYFKKPNIIFLRIKKGIDFSSPDGKPVNLFFMTCSPNEFVHIRLLAQISKLLHEPKVTEKFTSAKTKEEIIRILLEFERENFFATK